jgi:antitoxin component of RelBE/YafQ-DinJ toxin-antitoxin module
MLSRLIPKSEQKQIIQDLSNGKIDICIGTHRLLQKDIRVKNLGLVIVDEEHRFGVFQKDRLKEMRLGVDYLSMSATPIPRTLSMTMSGLKDMSTIDTAPEDRLPVKTFVSEESEELILEAINREVSRQGQVYYLHNRVHSIHMIANKLKDLMPTLRIGIAHGRMLPDNLDKVMTDFVSKKFDVLVCTTIIESGLDLPSVNTLIVDNAGGHLMQNGKVDMCIVGSDRTALNGDVCNKIGTYMKALCAYDNNIPFYVALPESTIDFNLDSGVNKIKIEERSNKEITHVSGLNSLGELSNVKIVSDLFL